MPIALIIFGHNKDLEILQDFAGQNGMGVVCAEVSGSVGVGYFRQEDMLDCLSLSEHIGVAYTLYKIAQLIIPCLPHPSPTNSSCSLK